MRAAIIGFLIGVLLDIILLWCGPLPTALLDILCSVSTPVAYVISWMTGWSFHQEEGILIYSCAIPVTLPLIGLMLGFVGAVFVRRGKKGTPKGL